VEVLGREVATRKLELVCREVVHAAREAWERHDDPTLITLERTSQQLAQHVRVCLQDGHRYGGAGLHGVARAVDELWATELWGSGAEADGDGVAEETGAALR
jgi:hypothetical protein